MTIDLDKFKQLAEEIKEAEKNSLIKKLKIERPYLMTDEQLPIWQLTEKINEIIEHINQEYKKND